MSNFRNLIFVICLLYIQESYSESFITPLTLDGLEELSRGVESRSDDCQEEVSGFSLGEEGQKKGEYTAFVNLQFIAIAPDGQRSFQSVRPPIVPIDLVYTSIANGKGVPREEIVAKSESEIREIIAKSNLRIGADVLSGPAFKDALDNAFLIQKLSRIDDEKTMYATLASEMKSESYLKKVDFLASFLYYLNQNYDYTSLGINGTADIKATDMDLMRGIRESIRTGKPVEAGVCRHMHKLAIKMAQAMGIENAYTVAYNTSDSAHMNMVIQDPADPTRVFQLNYAHKKEITGLTGPEALTQNHGGVPSDGINLRVFNHKEEHAITLPTEEGGILNRVTGGEDRDLSPDYKSKSQFRQAGVQTPYGTVRFFNASSPLGNQGQVSGAAYNVRLTYNDLYYGEYGVAGFMSERVIDNNEVSETRGVYQQTTQGLKVKVYESPEMTLSAFTELHFRKSTYCASLNDGKCLDNADSGLSSLSGVNARFQLGNTWNRTSFVVQNQTVLNDMKTSRDKVITTPVTQVSHDTDFHIVSSLDGNAGGELTFYHIGPGTHGTYNGHLGLRERKSRSFFQVQVDGRLTDNVPIWLPDSEKSVSGTMGTTFFSDKLYLNLDGRKSLDFDGSYYLGIGVGGAISTGE